MRGIFRYQYFSKLQKPKIFRSKKQKERDVDFIFSTLPITIYSLSYDWNVEFDKNVCTKMNCLNKLEYIISYLTMFQRRHRKYHLLNEYSNIFNSVNKKTYHKIDQSLKNFLRNENDNSLNMNATNSTNYRKVYFAPYSFYLFPLPEIRRYEMKCT